MGKNINKLNLRRNSRLRSLQFSNEQVDTDYDETSADPVYFYPAYRGLQILQIFPSATIKIDKEHNISKSCCIGFFGDNANEA